MIASKGLAFLSEGQMRQTKEAKRIVFLDYDGVVNRKMWVNEDGQWIRRFGYPSDGAVNDTQAVQWVSEFCERFGYDIVVSSTWRKYPEWADCLRAAGLRESVKIIDATPLPRRNRVREISDYLSEHGDVESYLIFDDDRSLIEVGPDGSHSGHVVLCCKDRGFSEEEYNKAVELHRILNSGCDGSNDDAYTDREPSVSNAEWQED